MALPKKYTPHQYQAEAIQHMLATPCCGLFLPPGLGKTSSVLAACKVLRAQGLIKSTLIVAPLRVMNYTWRQEAEKWLDFEATTFQVLHGKDKEVSLGKPADVYLINFEGLLWLLPKLAKMKVFPFDMLVVDESTKLKAHNTRRFKMLKPLLSMFKRRVILTGTPAPNSLMDLFAQAYIMDQGKALGRYITHFKAEFFELDAGKQQPGQRPNAWAYKLKPDADQDIRRRLEHLVYTHNGAGYIEDQTPVFNDVFVDLPPLARKQYNTMERLLMSQMQGGVILAANAAVASAKCIAEGTEVLTDSGWVRIEHLDSTFSVWDGISWVSIDGLRYNGYADTVVCCGVRMTADHLVLTQNGWLTAKDILDGEPDKGYDRASVRLPDNCETGRYPKTHRHFRAGSMASAVRLWKYYRDTWGKPAAQKPWQSKVMRLPVGADTYQGKRPTRAFRRELLGCVGCGKGQVHKPEQQRLGRLRWAWHNILERLGDFRAVLGRHGPNVPVGANSGPDRCKQRVLCRKLQVGHCYTAGPEQAEQRANYDAARLTDSCGSIGEVQYRLPDTVPQTTGRMDGGEATYASERRHVFDLINAGPNSRFTVRGVDGEPVIVHNCRQISNGHLYIDDKHNYEELHDEKLDAVGDLLEELSGQPTLVWYEYQSDLKRLLRKFPGEVLTASSPRDIVDRWNAKEIPILYVHHQSAAHGLNLQFGGNVMIYFSVPWSGEGYSQGIKRLARQGQTTQVIVHRILARKTVDEAVVKALALKEATQEDMLRALREYWAAREQET